MSPNMKAKHDFTHLGASTLMPAPVKTVSDPLPLATISRASRVISGPSSDEGCCSNAAPFAAAVPIAPLNLPNNVLYFQGPGLS